MHGRLKVKSTAQKEAERKKEEQEKLVKYKAARNRVFELRSNHDDELLKITTQLLIFNCECNTFWNIRKEFVSSKVASFRENDGNESDNIVGDNIELDKFFAQELAFTVQCLRKNPKAYAVWLYREYIMTLNPKSDWSHELVLCDEFLKLDERNFHCWDYRRVVLKHIPERKKELELQFTTSKIEDNFSNFSSWHYRTKLLCGEQRYIDCCWLSEKTVRSEIELVFNALFTDPSDQSAWFYYRWMHGNNSCSKCSIVSTLVLRKFSSISILFSHYLSRQQLDPVKITLCSSPVRYTLKPVHAYPETTGSLSNLWVFSIVSSSIPPFGTIDISIQFPEDLTGVNSLKLTVSENDKLCFNVNSEVIQNEHRSELQTAFPEVYEYNKAMLLDLAKEEPDNKFVLLQLSSFYRGSLGGNDQESKNECLKVLDKLMSVDALRKRYYEDIRSDVTIECEILKRSSKGTSDSAVGDSEKKEDLSLRVQGLRLTQIRRLSPLLMLSYLDLSDNELESIGALKGFMNLKVLRLDRNMIRDLSPLSMCYSLTTFSADTNLVDSLKSLESLSECHSLITIDLSNNKVCSVEQFSQQMVLLFPRLESLNGSNVLEQF